MTVTIDSMTDEHKSLYFTGLSADDSPQAYIFS